LVAGLEKVGRHAATHRAETEIRNLLYHNVFMSRVVSVKRILLPVLIRQAGID
jgi:hypothetical protein